MFKMIKTFMKDMTRTSYVLQISINGNNKFLCLKRNNPKL